METTEKFSTKLNKAVLARLRKYSKQSSKKISLITSEAIAQYLERADVRPAFSTAVEEVLTEHQELLKELAK